MLKILAKRSNTKIFIRGLIVIEVTFFGIAYYYYHRMNTSREFRYKMYNKNFELLDGFYKLGEFFGDTTTRKLDLQAWGIEESKKSSFK